MEEGTSAEIYIDGVLVPKSDRVVMGAQGVIYGKTVLAAGQQMTIFSRHADRNGMVRAAELANIRDSIKKMPLWFYPAWHPGNPVFSHIYNLVFKYATVEVGGQYIFTDNLADVVETDLWDSDDTGDYPNKWGCSMGDRLYQAGVQVLHRIVPVNFHQLDRLDVAYNDAVVGAKMLLTLTGTTVTRNVYEIRTSAFDGALGPYPLYGTKEAVEGEQPLETEYWSKSTQTAATSGLQVGIFGLIERGGHVAADFLGGGGGTLALDSTSEEPQVVDCGQFVSAYLKHRANYLGFYFCFIPAELSFDSVVGPFEDIPGMLRAVESASHKMTNMQFVGWHRVTAPGDSFSIFTGTQECWSVTWSDARLEKGVVDFDPDAVTLQENSMLQYGTVPST